MMAGVPTEGMYDGLQVGDTITHDEQELLVAWRAVHPDLRSSHGYRWPWPGQWAEAPLPDGAEFTRNDPCPSFAGDGLCLALTWQGAASGGIPALCGLLVAYRPDDVLGGDVTKVRVTRALVLDVIDPPRLLREGCGRGADLGGAYLAVANLRGADLYGANLRGADLRGADLYGAYLAVANLRGADLGGAYLRGADLRGADLRGANLRGADLRGANLYGADLRGANLRGALGVPSDARERGALV